MLMTKAGEKRYRGPGIYTHTYTPGTNYTTYRTCSAKAGHLRDSQLIHFPIFLQLPLLDTRTSPCSFFPLKKLSGTTAKAMVQGILRDRVAALCPAALQEQCATLDRVLWQWRHGPRIIYSLRSLNVVSRTMRMGRKQLLDQSVFLHTVSTSWLCQVRLPRRSRHEILKRYRFMVPPASARELRKNH